MEIGMNSITIDPTILGSVAAGLTGIGLFARKMFVNWTKENVTVAGAEVTTAMMGNFHVEINRLAKLNTEMAASNALLAVENAQHKKQIARLEALIERIAVKFKIDISDLAHDDV
jgi:hypothetical protein